MSALSTQASGGAGGLVRTDGENKSPFMELCDPVTGQIDKNWYRLRLRYRRPFMFFLSMHSSFGAFLKRLMDIVVSLLALIILSPVFLVTAIAIKLESKGPVFFRQRRVGSGGREFDFYKFRSMVIDAEKLKAELLKHNESTDGVIFKMKNDPRITRVGRFIRKFSIDEIPQFYNVLRGDMSLVGPRPPVPGEVVFYDSDAWERLNVIPGLTCLWQVSGRSAIGFRDQVRLDVGYVMRQDVFYDISLIIRTIPVVLRGSGAF
ncbi:MAG: sugar transferase [bacterium]|nr:sugar transferase [Candidatus Sumerlaeota bacterium]